MRPRLKLRKTRTAYVAIATIMLAGPASAFALTSTAADNSSATGLALQVNVIPRRTHLNHSITVTGIAPAADVGHWAILDKTPGDRSSWRNLASTTIGPNGRFELHARVRSSGRLRVIDSVTRPTTGADAPAQDVASPQVTAASEPVAVTVAAQLRVAHPQRGVLGGDPVVVRGRLLPGRAGRRVHLLGHFPHGWRAVASTRTGAKGGFTLRYSPAGGVERRLRVAFAGDAYNARTWAPAGLLTVYTQAVASWYDDAGSTACGFHAGLGVANKTLPCGTKVTFSYGGRTVTATVDDRGPYIAGRTYDLNQNTAAALSFNGVGTVLVTR